MSTNAKDAAILVRTLMNSTCIHALNNIANSKDKHAYLKAMCLCYYLVSEEVSGSDLAAMKEQLLHVKRDAPKRFITRFEVFCDTKRHYLMAIDHAIDIVNSMNLRFVSGNSHPDTIFIRNILEERLNRGMYEV